jgi:hypothetical protein
MIIHKLVLAQRVYSKLHLFNKLAINSSGNIVVLGRSNNKELDRKKSNIYKESNLTIEYYIRTNDKINNLHNIEVVKFVLDTGYTYEEPLSILFIRSFLGFNFNPIKDISGNINLDELKISGKSIKWPYETRKNKLSTKYERIFLDKWITAINSTKRLEIQYKYYNKWCESLLVNKKKKNFNKKYTDLFLFNYRAIVDKIRKVDLNIIPEVLVVANNKYYFLDFFIPSLSLSIEIDGYHHYFDPKTFEDDIDRTLLIRKVREIDIYRLPNNDINSITKLDMINILEACFDRAGYLATKSIQGLDNNYLSSYKSFSNDIICGQSAAKLPDYSSEWIAKGYKKLLS